MPKSPLYSYIYLIQRKGTREFKIGKADNVQRRLKQHQTGNAGELKLVKKVFVRYPFSVETFLKNKYRKQHLRKNGEWFKFTRLQLIGVKLTMHSLENPIWLKQAQAKAKVLFLCSLTSFTFFLVLSAMR